MAIGRMMVGALVAAGLCVASVTPAMAGPGGWSRGGGHGWSGGRGWSGRHGWSGHRGWGRGWNGWGGYRGYRGYGYPRYGYGYGYRDRFDFGDFLLGAVIAGGIAAAVASSRDRDRHGDRTARSDADRDRDYEAEDRAARLCSDAAEREASQRGDDARVEQISDVSRDGADGWRVEGRLEDRDRYQDGRPFVCGVKGDQVAFVDLGERAAAY